MMAIHLTQNQYIGINPHLQSLLQTQPNFWVRFHNLHLEHIIDKLNQILPDDYQAFRVDTLFSQRTLNNNKILPNSEPSAVLIKQITASDSHSLWDKRITRITRIELLSPCSKLGGSAFHDYVQRRGEALEKGMVLVELDYLHETPPLMRGLPVYHPTVLPSPYKASTYNILVCDARLGSDFLGETVYSFSVDKPIPTISIPLADDEKIDLPLDEIYQYAFERQGWGIM